MLANADEVCRLCGAFVQLSPKTIGRVHSPDECPLRDDTPQLVAIWQNISQRLAKFCALDLHTYAEQLNILLQRKHVVELQLRENGVSFAVDSRGKIMYYETSDDQQYVQEELTQFELDKCVELMDEARENLTNGEESDDEYQTFVRSLQPDVKTQSRALTSQIDDDFTAKKQHREPEEEYFDDDEVRVSHDELLQLFDGDDDDEPNLLSQQSPVHQFAQQAQQIDMSQTEVLLSSSALEEFVNQMRMNFQIVVQAVAISKEFQMPCLKSHEHWRRQMNGLIAMCSNKAVIVCPQNAQPLVPLLSTKQLLLRDSLVAMDAAPMSPQFHKFLTGRWDDEGVELVNSRSRKYKVEEVPLPNALTELTSRIGEYLLPELLIDWQIDSKRHASSLAEDDLLLFGLLEYGVNYLCIRQQLLPHRTTEQVNARAKNRAHKRHDGNSAIRDYFFRSRRPITEHEQRELHAGVQMHGYNFHRIAATGALHGRTVGELRRAYAHLHERMNPPRYDYAFMTRADQVLSHVYGKLLILPEDEDYGIPQNLQRYQ